MAIVPQKLFGWKEIEELGDLERLVLLLKALPDEKLMRKWRQIASGAGMIIQSEQYEIRFW